MEQCLRLALWMFLFIGYLQAKPITSTTTKPRGFIMEDLRLHLLSRAVSCDPSVNFTSPANVQKHCYSAALMSFLDELDRVKTVCTVKYERNEDTIDALRQNTELLNAQVNSSECQWEKKPFANFTDDIKSFASQVNDDLGK